MSLFISTYINKIDKKGRVSVPASFRAALSNQPFQGIIIFPSSKHQSLEGFGWDTMEKISSRLDELDMFSQQQDDLATSIFGESVQLPFDGDGRVILPPQLSSYADITNKVAFVGLGKKFQIWNPEKLEQRKKEAKSNIEKKSITLPKGGQNG